MARRTQTLVQLTDELVETLDRRATARGISRSALIRELLHEALADAGADEMTQRMIAGYRAAPQEVGRDAWGDLDLWTQANVRRNLAGLAAEEEEESW